MADDVSTRYSWLRTPDIGNGVLVQSRRSREREGGGSRLDIPYDETGVSADFIKANSEVVGIYATKRKGITGPRVAHGKGHCGST